MYKFDLYTGEPSMEGSPPNLSQSELSQQEIVQNANMTFDYDPNQRMNQMYQQQQYYVPGLYGYNQGMFGNFMNPPIMQNQQSGFQGYVGNPAFQYMQNIGMQNPYMMKPQCSDYTYYIPGFNTGSRVLLPSDAEEVCERLQAEMSMELEEANAQRIAKQQQYYNNLGMYNYYGTPYAYSYYADPSITNKYKRKIEEMRKQAEEARNNLNRNLSRLTQNYLYGEVDEGEIDKLYEGRFVTVPGAQIQQNYDQQRLAAMKPIDTSYQYQQHNANISTEYAKYFDENTDMNSFLRDVGQVISAERLEEETHRRRDVSGLYQQDGAYKSLIRQKLRERYKTENEGGQFNIPNLNNQDNNIPMGGSFPTLQQSAKLLDDGTLQISAPAWLGNKQYSIKNTMEDEYEANRNRFLQSIYRDNPMPGGGQNGNR